MSRMKHSGESVEDDAPTELEALDDGLEGF